MRWTTWQKARSAAAAMGLFGLAAAGCNAALGVDEFSADGCPGQGVRGCSGKTVLICGEDGEWLGGDECAKACVEGVCVPECAAGQRRCAGDSPQVCDDSGLWMPPEGVCGPEAPCSAGVCGAVCVPGDLRCLDGTTAQTCESDGKWHGDQVCPKGCASGMCAECKPGEKKCENNTPRECSLLGQWIIGKPCKKDQQCSDTGICEQQQ